MYDLAQGLTLRLGWEEWVSREGGAYSTRHLVEEGETRGHMFG